MEAEEFLKNSKNIDYSKLVHVNGLFDVLPFIEADLIEYAKLYHEAQLIKLHQPTVSGRSEQLCQCKDAPTKHFIKNWCDDCKKHIV